MFALDLAPPAYVTEALPAGDGMSAPGAGMAAGCDGLMISKIEIRTYPPSSTTASERAVIVTPIVARLSGQRSEHVLVRAYLRLQEGELCTEEARRESERLIRAQRLFASAAVRAYADGAGGVVVRVHVVDEVPGVLGAVFDETSVTALTLGTRSYRGRGIAAVVGLEEGGVYRTGGRLLLGQYGVFGHPALADIELIRRPLGGLLRVGIAEPFLVDGQERAMHASFSQEVEYGRLVREGREDATSQTRRTMYSLGYLRRVGATFRSGLVGLGGVMVMGTDVRSNEGVVVISDSGLVATTDTELTGSYPNFAVGRVAAVVALRAMRFRTVRRFETLRAEQDVGSGAQLEVLMGPSLGSVAGSRDVLAAADLYLGSGGSSAFASLRLRAEGRRLTGRDTWRGVVASGHFSWYRLTSDTRTRTFSASVARVDDLVFPTQLTFRDADGGLIGFVGSKESGGRRAVVRIEERRLVPFLGSRGALAVGAFADAGALWAGDVPYGSTSPLRSSAGVSLFAAVPSASKRLYRVDFGVPLNPETGGGRYAIRLSSADRTGAFWMEPHDVARSRANTATLTRW